MSARAEIIKALFERPGLAIHEMNIMGHSQTALSARTRELAREGIVEGFRAPGKAYKIWKLVRGSGISNVSC